MILSWHSKKVSNNLWIQYILLSRKTYIPLLTLVTMDAFVQFTHLKESMLDLLDLQQFIRA